MQILFKGIFCFKAENPLKTGEILFSILGLVNGIIRQIGKWSEMSLLKNAVLKFLSIKELVQIWSIAVVLVLVTLVDLFMVGIIPFL